MQPHTNYNSITPPEMSDKAGNGQQSSANEADPAMTENQDVDPETLADLAKLDNLFSSTISEDSSWAEGRYYNWRTYWKNHEKVGFRTHALMIMHGVDSKVAEQTDEDVQDNLLQLARLLKLLREYYSRYGMPEEGGPRDREYVLREVLKDLYSGGAPIWALGPVMTHAAEGLTGNRGVEFMFLPRNALIFSPKSGGTTMCDVHRGFDMSRLAGTEGILVRLASYASNTKGVASLPTRMPTEDELAHAYRSVSDRVSVADAARFPSKASITNEILKIASHSEGIFFFLNSTKRPNTGRPKTKTTEQWLEPGKNKQSNSDLSDSFAPMTSEKFWDIDETTSELFSRLAALDAIDRIEKMDARRKVLYSPIVMLMFRFLASAGACTLWYKGSWIDMLCAGFGGVIVGLTSKALSTVQSKEERIIFEAVASFFVGVFCGVVVLAVPEQTCFSAMSIGGVVDILQGFRVVYAVIEVLSRNSVTGSADFLESILYTGVIAYFLQMGLYAISAIWKGSIDYEIASQQCTHPMNELWYIFFMPAGSLGWSGLFNPNYRDLPLMTWHGVIACAVSWGLAKVIDGNISLFVAALCVTLSAGFISRISGRSAIGNSLSGIYVLLPGAYLVRSVFQGIGTDFIANVIMSSTIIGVGAWTGTILVSPTLLGTNHGLLRLMARHRDDGKSSKGEHQEKPHRELRRAAAMTPGGHLGAEYIGRDKWVRESGAGAALFF